jgi:hypothetical protein
LLLQISQLFTTKNTLRQAKVLGTFFSSDFRLIFVWPTQRLSPFWLIPNLLQF